MRKHGLRPVGVLRHSPRGALERDRLAALVSQDLSVRDIAILLDRSYTTVRYWLRRYGLQTSAAARRADPTLRRVVRECARHGLTDHVLSSGDKLRCARCRAEAVTRYRQEAKRRLVEESGGRCELCGYDECIAALQFHHRDPATKRFAIGSRRLARSMEALREEAAKCTLLCANCHVAVEAGVRVLAD